MKYLGVDYGRSKVGISLAVAGLAEPYRVIRYQDLNTLKGQIAEIVKKEEIDKIVVGVSEGKSKEEAEDFGKNLCVDAPVVFFDETLSTQLAQALSREAGVKRKKRKALEDAFAASVMLQSFLDSNV